MKAKLWYTEICVHFKLGITNNIDFLCSHPIAYKPENKILIRIEISINSPIQIHISIFVWSI